MRLADIIKTMLLPEAKLDGSCQVKILTIPESIGGAVGIRFVDIKKVEIEDDGNLTIVVEV